MKKGAFISMVENPSNLNGENINELKDILNEFPYFSAAHTLLTKAYYEEEHINFEQQLRKTAAIVTDRKQLHDLLFSNNNQINEATAKEAPKTADIDQREDENEEIKEKREESSERHVEKDPLENQIISAAINQSILREMEDSAAEDIASDASKKVEADNPPIPYELEEKNVSGTNFDENKPHSFHDWISHYSIDSKDDNSESELWKNTSKESKEALQELSKSVQKKQDFYSASKMAKLSVKENDDLVTETLAKIYVAQKNYDKAIKAYEKLQLKYPEKKIYFANQIRTLKNNLNL